MLDLDVDVFPCPKGGTVWRPKAVELGGKAQFPFLVDPNSGGGSAVQQVFVIERGGAAGQAHER